MYISSQIGQEYTVITVDQTLYYKLIDLKWAIPEYKDKLIPHLGGLHISMNFLKVIGQHLNGLDALSEAGILGRSTIQLVMAEKAYNKGMQSHKLTFLLPESLEFLQTKNADLMDEFIKLTDAKDIEKLTTMLRTAMYCVFFFCRQTCTSDITHNIVLNPFKI